MHEWNSDCKTLLRHIIVTGPRDLSLLKIVIVGYSWGVGHGAMTLVRLLRGEGIEVERLVSCDGVYHSWWFPWKAFFSIL
ncbi:hypothetical protein, partial [Streptococcus pseudopneumoniae]|uniref:hypothetical protein n=1 Tax=Streptococcus pseudopneumoniae TaxID=257758 RepID=UPI0019D5EC62